MLSLETTDAWTSASIALTVDGNPAETYTHAGQASAYYACEDFATWANDGARAWSGGGVFYWTWAKGDNCGAKITLVSSGFSSVSWAPNATWSNLLLQSSGSAATLTASNGAAGTACPSKGNGDGSYPAFWSVRGALQFSGASGDASAAQAIRPFVPGLAGTSPKISAKGDVLDAARLTSVAASASNPRRLRVYQGYSSSWLELAAGAFTVESFAPKLFAFSVDAAGAAL